MEFTPSSFNPYSNLDTAPEGGLAGWPNICLLISATGVQPTLEVADFKSNRAGLVLMVSQ